MDYADLADFYAKKVPEPFTSLWSMFEGREYEIFYITNQNFICVYLVEELDVEHFAKAFNIKYIT